MAIESHLARHTRSIGRKCLAKKCLCGCDTTIAAKQEIEGLAMFVDRSIKMVPLGFDRDVRLIDAPRRTDGSREPVPSLLILRNISSHPSKGSSNARL